MSLVHIVAVITAHSGKRGDILSAFKANVPLVHQEEGCIEYGAVVDTENVFRPEIGRFRVPMHFKVFRYFSCHKVFLSTKANIPIIKLSRPDCLDPHHQHYADLSSVVYCSKNSACATSHWS